VLVLLACVVALACAAASLRRLSFALAPTPLDPKALSDALAQSQPSLNDVEKAIAIEPTAKWERELVRALKQPAEVRAGDVNEQLLELEQLASRWARVPRVCASVATSFGFLLGSLALRQALTDPEAGQHIEHLVGQALNVVSVGIAGTVICIAVHFRAGKAAKSRLAVVDGLVERLEKLVPEGES
jgi:hypothetical protein